MPPRKKVVSVKDEDLQQVLIEVASDICEKAQRRQITLSNAFETFVKTCSDCTMDQIRRTIDQETLKMPLPKFVEMHRDDQVGTNENLVPDPIVRGVPNIPLVRKVKVEVEEPSNHESASTSNGVTPNSRPGIQETAKRPQNQLQNHPFRTPLGNSVQLPTLIKTKFKSLWDNEPEVFRRPRANEEVAFSIDGSPIDLLTQESKINQGLEQIQQILNEDEDALSPNTREIAAGLRALIMKKVERDFALEGERQSAV